MLLLNFAPVPENTRNNENKTINVANSLLFFRYVPQSEKKRQNIITHIKTIGNGEKGKKVLPAKTVYPVIRKDFRSEPA